MVEVDIGIKRTATLTFEIVEKYLMLMGEEDMGLIPATIPPTYQVAMLDCWVYQFLIVLLTIIFMDIREFDIVVMATRGVT